MASTPHSTAPLADLTGRTVVVTGASSGIGRATARALAAAGARVVLAVRNTVKGAEVASSIPGETLVRPLDLSDLHSVRHFADAFDEPIDVLVNNAGVSVAALARTADGFEMQFGTNHLGPFALTNLLLPRITGRVVSLSSQAERMGKLRLDDLNWERTPYKEFPAYAASKLADLLFTAELQRRLTAAGSGVTTAAAHPGFVATNMTGQSTGLTRVLTRYLAQSPEDGALPVLLAATGDVPGDSFTGPQRMMHMRGGAELIGRSKQATDPVLAARLWEASEKMTGVSFPLWSQIGHAAATVEPGRRPRGAGAGAPDGHHEDERGAALMLGQCRELLFSTDHPFPASEPARDPAVPHRVQRGGPGRSSPAGRASRPQM